MPPKRKARSHYGRQQKHRPSVPAHESSIPDKPIDIEVDGSLQEGGGQIVRAAVALSCILDRSIRIRKIRYSRPKPGLQAQHCAGVKLTSLIANAQTYGANFGSSTLAIFPSSFPPTPSNSVIGTDVGTAGAISLVLQAFLPVALRVLPSSCATSQRKSFLQTRTSKNNDELLVNREMNEQSDETNQQTSGPSLRVSGGTCVAFAPSSDYVQNVLAPNLLKFGILLDYKVEKHGFFPRGGGTCSIYISKADINESVESNMDLGLNTSSASPLFTLLRPVNVLERGNITSVQMTILTSGISAKDCSHISDKMLSTVVKYLHDHSGNQQISSLSTDPNIVYHSGAVAKAMTACVTLYAKTESGFTIGVSRIWCEKDVKRLSEEISLPSTVGFRAYSETAAHIAKGVVEEFCEAVKSGAVVDKNMADQLVLFLAMAKGKSKMLLPEPSLHMKTIVDLLRQFDVDVVLRPVGGSTNVVIECEGCGIPLRK